MASPSVYTANTLDAIVRSLSLATETQDVLLAAEEFALGIPLATRTLDLCWGYAPIEGELAANSNKELVISQGLTRRSGTLATVQNTETGFAVASATYLGSDKLQNVYAYGSVFLVDASPKPTIEVKLLRGGTGGTGSPILSARDYDITAAIQMVYREDIPTITPPAGTVLEIVRFVLDITYYNGGPSPQNKVKMYLIDSRKPRGWGGYAEENMGLHITPALILNYRSTKETTDEAKNHVKNIVSEWVNLPSWEPNFLEFWKKSGSNKMPVRLEQFLLDELDITLLP